MPCRGPRHRAGPSPLGPPRKAKSTSSRVRSICESWVSANWPASLKVPADWWARRSRSYRCKPIASESKTTRPSPSANCPPDRRSSRSESAVAWLSMARPRTSICPDKSRQLGMESVKAASTCPSRSSRPCSGCPQSIAEHWPQVGRFRLDCELHGGFARPEERRGWSGEGKAHTSIGC